MENVVLLPEEIKKGMFVDVVFDDSPEERIRGYVRGKRASWVYLAHHKGRLPGMSYYYSSKGMKRWHQRGKIGDEDTIRPCSIYQAQEKHLPESIDRIISKRIYENSLS